MSAVLVLLTAATLGIDVGWQPSPDGGIEYIIQIEPETYEALGAGQAIQSDIATNLSNIRSYRIFVGTKELPHQMPLPTVAQKSPTDDAGGSVQITPPFPATPPPTPPEALPPNVPSKPLLGQSTNYSEPTESLSTSAAMRQQAFEGTSESQPEPPAKPWLPLIFTLLGLFASFGGNVFLGWVVWDLRKRCQSLLSTSASMKATAFLAGWCLVPIAAMFLSANAFAADPAEPSKPTAIEDMTTCELVLGKSIENVVLVDQRGRSVAFRRSGSSMFVMPGEYSIQEITLQGGYVARFLSGSSMNRITLIPDKPCQFDVRLPLTSAIAVTRAGRLLKLDYQLLDGDGRKYTRNAAGALSRFTIYQGDRKIGSGSFEYG